MLHAASKNLRPKTRKTARFTQAMICYSPLLRITPRKTGGRHPYVSPLKPTGRHERRVTSDRLIHAATRAVGAAHRRDVFERDLCMACRANAERFRGGIRKIDDATARERPAVVDAHHHRARPAVRRHTHASA